MRHKYYFGSNLKMYKTVSQTLAYLYRLEELTEDIGRDETELFILPSFVSLDRAMHEIDSELIRIGAQTMYWEREGRFTGEISPVMLCEMGIRLVMAGHSERRNTFGESSRETGYRVSAAVRHGMTALLCVGESEKEKDSGIAEEVIRTQVKAGLQGLTSADADRIRIAYEPDWAIGIDGKPAEPAYINDMHAMIKQTLSEIFRAPGEKVPVLYGGSVNPDNAVSYAKLDPVDGLFIGRAAWDADNFNALIRKVLKADR